MDCYYNYPPDDGGHDPYNGNQGSDNPFSYNVHDGGDGDYDDVDELLDEIGEYMRHIPPKGA